jgi:hypothetical protein
MRPTLRFIAPLALALAFAGCRAGETEAAPPGPAAAPEAPPPATVTAMEARLEAAGVAVDRVARLAGHTLCTGEEWRYRFHFGGPDFLNVSRFPSGTAAHDCVEAYRLQVGKAGQAAVERLMPLVSVEGPYLFQFSERMTDPRRRDEILAAAKQGLPADGT